MGDFGIDFIIFIIAVIAILFNIFYLAPLARKKYEAEIESVISGYDYYLRLNSEQKKRFINIIKRFNSDLKYYGKEGLSVTAEMKIIIGAGFAKLSMGRDFKRLYTFHTIVIFPSSYKATEQKVKYLGKTSLQGYISLSWEDILKGESNLHDGINLVIHELSHALVIEMMQSQPEFVFEYSIVKHIYYNGKKEIEAVENGKEPIFRKYAYSSPHEFFSIAVEVFFELPEKLIENYWGLYRDLCVLFKQNPLKNEIGNISWDSILKYPHEPETLNDYTPTDNYIPFCLNYNKL